MKIIFVITLTVSLLSACTNKPAAHSKDSEQCDTIVPKNYNVSEDSNVYKSYIEDYQNVTNDSAPIDEYYSDPLVVSYTQHNDTMVIKENCVIFLWPDSLEIVEMQDAYPVRYLDILDDMISHTADAAIAMDADGIKNFFCDKSVIKFVSDPKDIILHRKKVEGDMLMFKYGEKPFVLYALEFDIEQAKAFFTNKKVDTLTNL